VDEPEAEHGGAEPVVAPRPADDADEADEDEAVDDDHVDQAGVEPPSGQGAGDQGGAVAEGEERDEADGAAGLPGQCDDAGEEQQVVPAEQHVGEAEPHEAGDAAGAGVGDVVGGRGGGAGGEERRGQGGDHGVPSDHAHPLRPRHFGGIEAAGGAGRADSRQHCPIG
jgi:hypothetical protein